MHKVAVSIGSNVEREHHVGNALNALNKHFVPLHVSHFYDCEPVGFTGNNFLNLVVTFDCDLSVGELAALLRSIEHDNGRIRGGEKYGDRTLDLDILTFDDLVGVIDGVELPRGEITEYAFVLCPLADVLPDAIHPVTQLTYSQMWNDFDQSCQKVTYSKYKWP
ncbi:2-amino-4-hydroxy-6-hydroxymethyldihydropteridine diphosphokinase [Thalassotalea euphylliae]|uniref:2-amino-4-hydroxy-6- hydroxymethyldihydropteridine diphosphokinase n=1 Tax=Thalassotalea euphylliae TaxID=1655234 RepID=UPI00363F2D88